MERPAGNKELRIALVMGGGVSLGTFSSGALVELAHRLDELANRRSGKVVIDVATGASAGAMTLAVFYRYLYAGARPETLTAALRDCWVDGVGMDPREHDRQLLPDLRRHRRAALLSDRPLRVLGRRHVLTFQGDGSAPNLLADTAYLSFSLTNLNGLEFRAPSHWPIDASAQEAGQDALRTTSFEDRIRFRLHKGELTCVSSGPVDPLDRARPIRDLREETWTDILDAAMASGAFPGAFAPVSILRFPEEYDPGIWPDKLQGQPHRYSYVDGGLLNNEPLKEALGLAQRLDRGDDPVNYERMFVFVDPVVSGRSSCLRMADDIPVNWRAHYDPQRDDFDYSPRGSAYMRSIKSDLARVSSVVFGQATFQDWMKLGKINQRAEWLRSLVELCSPHLLDMKLPNALQRDLDALAQKIEHIQGPATRSCDWGGSERESRGAMVLLDLVASISGMEDKRDVKIIAVSPFGAQHARVKLAGDFAGAFGGFFNRAWRAHDFEVGRVIMQNTLSRDSLAVEFFGECNEVEPLPVLPSGYEQVAPAVKAHFERVLQGHLESLLQELGVPHFVDHLLAWRLRHAMVQRLTDSTGAQVRSLMFRITGEGIKEAHALLGCRQEHSTPAFGEPLALVTVVEAMHDPRAVDGRPSYRIHGPELFSESNGFHFRVVGSDVPDIGQERARLSLHPDPKQWFDLAEHTSLIEVIWDGQTELKILPERGLAQSSMSHDIEASEYA